MDGNLTYLDSDPLCKCAQKLSQVSFGCTFLFGSTVVMINLIMFVHLSFGFTLKLKIQLSLHAPRVRASWVLINVLQVWRRNLISVWRHIKEYMWTRIKVVKLSSWLFIRRQGVLELFPLIKCLCRTAWNGAHGWVSTTWQSKTITLTTH